MPHNGKISTTPIAKRKRSPFSSTTSSSSNRSSHITSSQSTIRNKSQKKIGSSPSQSQNNFLEQLSLLRSFLCGGYTHVSEATLSSCLRRSGYNVERAAEMVLLNGGEMMQSDGANEATKRRPTKTSRESTIDLTDDIRVTAKPPPESNRPQHLPSSKYLLCKHWIVGFSTTTRNGKISYKETLHFSASSSGPCILRFLSETKKLGGTLSHELSSFLVPLLRSQKTCIAIEGCAVMEETDVRMGGEVPMEISVCITDPKEFFRLTNPHGTSRTSLSSTFRKDFLDENVPDGKKAPKSGVGAVPRPEVLAGAAFSLLQFAQLGDFHLRALASADSEAGADDDSSSLTEEEEPVAALMNEDDFQQEGAGDEETESPLQTSVLNEDSARCIIPEEDQPVGLSHPISLRSYQKQALYWMKQRENDPMNRTNIQQELSLLSELVGGDSSLQNSNTFQSHGGSGNKMECECGPVKVAHDLEVEMLEGGICPEFHHPLWQKRFLAKEDMSSAVVFYVNELFKTASIHPPNPPKQCTGGILADAMGLGKTVMLLSLIMKTKEDSKSTADQKVGGDLNSNVGESNVIGSEEDTATITLVVTPLSLLSQWEEEISTKTDLSSHMYYGDSTRKSMTPQGAANAFTKTKADVVLTTYGTLQNEYMSHKKNPLSPSPLLSTQFSRIILDEAHCIKNPNTVISKACGSVRAPRRWCVTGTPVQNRLLDAYGLIKFLKHEPWCEFGFWKKAISSAEKDEEGGGMGQALTRVRKVLSPIVLRRTLQSVDENGRPILILPEMETKIVNVQFSHAERDFYNALLSKSQAVFEGFIKKGTASKSWFAIFSLLCRLRLACDHVALTVKSRLTLEDAGKPGKPDESVEEEDGDHVNDQFLQNLLQMFRSHTDKEEKTSSRTQEISPPAEEQSTSHSNEMFTQSVAQSLHKSIQSNSTFFTEECPICLDCPEIDKAVLTPCAHAFCKECLISALKEQPVAVNKITRRTTRSTVKPICPDGPCPVCNEWVSSEKIIAISKSKSGKAITSYLTESILQTQTKALSESEIADRSARNTLQSCLTPSNLSNSSAKLSSILEELDRVWTLDPHSKILIFSQFLGFLDILQSSLHQRNILTERLDGKMSLKNRMASLERFNTSTVIGEDDSKDSDIRRGSVFLISMKAGGVGLNLIAASTVFIADPWWNSAIEDQCIHRIHRIGQTAKVVRVRKFVVQDSVEEKIVALQKKKKNMVGEILQEGGGTEEGSLDSNKLAIEDFKVLFGG